MDMQTIQDWWHWLVTEGPDISNAWKGIAAIVAFVTLVGGYIFASRSKPTAPAVNQVVVSLSADDLAALVQSRLPKAGKEVAQDGTVEEFRRSLEYISAHRKLLEPPPLAVENFPKEMDVYDWTPGKVLKIRLPRPLGERVFEGTLRVRHYLIFPGLAGSILLSWLTPEFSGYIGAAVGFAFWVRNNRRGAILKLDFENKKWSISSPAAASWFPVLPREIWVKEGAVDGQPTLTLGIERYAIANVPADPTARLKLVTFTNSLLWA